MTKSTTLQDSTLFTVTEHAAQKIAHLIQIEPDEQLALRVHIQGGGCSGFEYCFSFDAAKGNEDDQRFHHHDFPNACVLIDSMSMQYLTGSTLDYKKDIQGERFIINNPNAKGTCGCGESFSA